jgi:hypothetical protein
MSHGNSTAKDRGEYNTAMMTLRLTIVAAWINLNCNGSILLSIASGPMSLQPKQAMQIATSPFS